MDTVYTGMPMVMCMTAIGKMMNNREMVCSNLLMDPPMKDNSCKASLMGRECTNSSLSSMTILSNIAAPGLHLSLMGLAKQSITTAISTKANLSKERDAVMGVIGSIESTSTLANGSTIASGGKANCIKTRTFSSRVFSKKD